MKRFGSLFFVLVVFLFAFSTAPQLVMGQDIEGGSYAGNSRILLEADDETSEDIDTDVDAMDERDRDWDAKKSQTSVKKDDADSPVRGHGFALALSFAAVPDSILGLWFKNHGSLWSDGAVNMGFALDYFLRFKAPAEMRFSLSWLNGRTSDDYWLDKNYKDHPVLAEYIVNRHSIISLEVAAYHVISIIDEIAFYYGGGGWVGVVLDDARAYAIRSSCAVNSSDITQCPHEPGSTPLTQMPPVFGFAMVTLGFKFTVWDVMTIRAEGGFKGYFYGQIGIGAEF